MKQCDQSGHTYLQTDLVSVPHFTRPDRSTVFCIFLVVHEIARKNLGWAKFSSLIKMDFYKMRQKVYTVLGQQSCGSGLRMMPICECYS